MKQPQQTFSIRVRNEPGVLTKVAGMFYRYGHNIESLSVGHTQIPGFSKLVVTLHMSLTDAERLRRALANLVDVDRAEILDPDTTHRVETGIVELFVADVDERAEILLAASEHGAEIYAERDESITLVRTGHPDDVGSFIESMHHFHLLDASRTGSTAVGPSRQPTSLETRPVHVDRRDDPTGADALDPH